VLLCHAVHGCDIAKEVLGGGQTIFGHTVRIPSYSGVAIYNLAVDVPL
jgi:hypothetical protein